MQNEQVVLAHRSADGIVRADQFKVVAAAMP
jgi:hypothetical protein